MKSLITNGLAASCVGIGYYVSEPLSGHLTSVGLFALSGALTNWLAVHMLFEKVPGLYGSGVIPARFEEFKLAIQQIIMEQFFTSDNIERFFQESGSAMNLELEPVIQKLDLIPAFDALVAVIKESSFGGMLGMIGGEAALEPMKEPFTEKMKESLIAMTATPGFQETLQEHLTQSGGNADIQERVAQMVQHRLDELTPQMVKTIVQDMIHEHLGWLVVWGGVFGGLIGLLTSFVR